MIREREREREKLLERGLSFACQQQHDPDIAGDVDEDDEEFVGRGHGRGLVEGDELFALLRELAGLQVRLATLMEKMGALPLDLIRDMRQEIIDVTDQLRNINRAHRR